MDILEIDELESIDDDHSYEIDDSTNRDCSRKIDLRTSWSWCFDFDNFVKEIQITWEDIEKLVDCDLKFLSDKIRIKKSFTGHFGSQKYVIFEETDTKREFRVMSENNGSFLLEHEGIPTILYDDDEIVDKVNQMYDIDTQKEYVHFIRNEFKNDLLRQTGLVLMLGFNNSILKAQRNQIEYKN